LPGVEKGRKDTGCFHRLETLYPVTSHT
jgi:hypothetical protein